MRLETRDRSSAGHFLHFQHYCTAGGNYKKGGTHRGGANKKNEEMAVAPKQNFEGSWKLFILDNKVISAPYQNENGDTRQET